jgi:uncharacterized protein YdeI (YjbR/CyaY-like superfamily)
MALKLKLVKKSFKVTLEKIPSRLGWTVIQIPFDVEKVWGTHSKLRVKGDINGFEFRSSVFPTREGHHCLLMNKTLRTGANISVGDTARFTIEPDTAKREAIVPPELARILKEDRAFRKWFEALSFSMRMWIGHWITMVKKPESRIRRAEQVAEQLMATMEAELELPPILQRAFATDPKAFEGWQSMTLLQRRGHLMGIFYYRRPESRDRRIAKTLEEARARAEGRKIQKPDSESDFGSETDELE